MYCGSCIHDNTLAAALIKQGHEVALIPTYTPLRTDEASVSIGRIFYGGINVYLEEKFPLFRRTPWFIDRLFNRPRLLNWLARRSFSTDARELGALTVSVLQGEHGPQKKELEKLVTWLKHDFRPELVQLTNSMFAGMARMLKNELGVPVLCAMQGEDIFLEALVEPYKSRALRILRERAQELDGFIATSEYYADFMAEFIGVARERIHVVRLGITMEGHGLAQRRRPTGTPLTIGYLARVCPEKGLHLLVDALALLHERGGAELRLLVGGFLGQSDRKYFNEVVEKVATLGLKRHFDYRGELNRQEKIDFINSLDLLSVPTVYREPKGLFALESLANGVPVVLPRHGAFPELIDATGGGILVEPNSVSALADGLVTLMQDEQLRHRLGTQGKAVVHRDYSDQQMAESTLKVYRQYLTSASCHSASMPIAVDV